MKNFIRNIKEHKKAALISLAVLLAVIAVTVLVVKLSGTGSSSDAESSLPEENASGEEEGPSGYFEDTAYPVSVSGRGQSMIISLQAKEAADQKWEYSCEPSGIVSVSLDGDETDGNASFALTPMKTGYSTVTFKRTGKVGELSYDVVSMAAEIMVYADENDAMYIRLENMRQDLASSGALESETPFLLAGNRVILPNGGDWTLTIEADGEVPEGYYSILPGTDDDGNAYFDVAVDTSRLFDDSGELSLAALGSKLLLKSEALSIEKRISCEINEYNELTLTEVEAE